MTISVHLISTYSGSSEEDFINEETYGTAVYDEIDSPIAVSSYNAASGLIAYYDRKESTLGCAHLIE